MLYRFELELSDIDRGVYETLEFRIAQHPSESIPYLLSRALAYALSYQEGLEFSPAGLGDPDAPALQGSGAHNSIDLWIEIGNPSARKLHKASKAARQVVVYTYKNVDLLLQEISSNEIHRSNQLLIYAFDTKFLEILEGQLGKNNRWSLVHQQGRLDITIGENTISTDIKQVST